ncbi:MAG TPA: ABC transporter permease [Candidatus Kapabacteria bacterium]|nr:ABC transporter permease [Candidatus Kapabacteria bacterium]
MNGDAFAVVRETALRSWRKTLRRPVPLTFSFVQPLFWMLIFGFLFHRFTLGPAYAGYSYLDFLLPGVCSMTVLFGASQAGITLVRDLQTGFLQRMVRASAHPHWILAGTLGAEVVRLGAQACIVALLGVALGARPVFDPAALLPAAVALALFALGYASLSCWIALKTKAQESMATFVHVVNMPLLFTSTALVPSRQMPAWLEWIARWNPLTTVADSLRDVLLLGRMPSALHLLPLLVGSLLLFLLAAGAMKHAARE